MRGALLFTAGLVIGVISTAIVTIVMREPDARPRHEVGGRGSPSRPAESARAADRSLDAPARPEAVDPRLGTKGPESATRAAGEDLVPVASPLDIDLEALLSALRQRRGRLLAGFVSRLLARGPEGFEVLAEFLERVAAEGRGLEVFRHPRLAMPLLRVAVSREEDVAALARFLLESRLPRGDSDPVHAGLLHYVTGWLAGDGTRFPALRELVAERLTWMLENPDANLSGALETLRALEMEADGELLATILSEPDHRRHHDDVIRELVHQDSPEAVGFLRAFIEGESGPEESASLKSALHALVRMADPSAARALDVFLQSAEPTIRENAILAFFSARRDLASLSLALDLLNHGVDDARKRSLVWELASVSPELLGVLDSNPGSLDDPKMRGFVNETRRWSRTAGRAAVDLLGRAATGRAIREYHPEGVEPSSQENPATDR